MCRCPLQSLRLWKATEAVDAAETVEEVPAEPLERVVAAALGCRRPLDSFWFLQTHSLESFVVSSSIHTRLNSHTNTHTHTHKHILPLPRSTNLENHLFLFPRIAAIRIRVHCVRNRKNRKIEVMGCMGCYTRVRCNNNNNIS